MRKRMQPDQQATGRPDDSDDNESDRNDQADDDQQPQRNAGGINLDATHAELLPAPVT